MPKFNMHFPAQRWRARAAMLVTIGALALLAACSSLRLAYSTGDTLLYWWLDAYVDLDAGQKADVKADIGDLFRWHRQTQLQDYIQVLRQGQKQLQGTPTQADLQADYQELLKRSQAVLMKSVPDLSELARSLRPEQIAQMEKKFEKNNADFRKKNMRGNAEEQKTFRYKKSMEQFELWFGSFSREQQQQIRAASDARPLDNQFWLEERMERQRAIVALVRKIERDKPDDAAAQAMIRDLIKANFDQLERPGRNPFAQAYRASTLEMVLAVIRIATPEQKAHAHQRMQGWIEDLQSLAR